MAKPEHNERYERKRKAAGWVRGPRITGLAAARLRDLAYQHRLDPCEVVSRLLLDIPLGEPVPEVALGVAGVEERARAAFQRRHGLSDSEMRDMDRENVSYVGI